MAFNVKELAAGFLSNPELIKAIMGLRVSEEEEADGVDMSECGMEAYPEFVTQ